jgi:aspartyl/asparaginyl beta-hydroxylase (cupin superfamily)
MDYHFFKDILNRYYARHIGGNQRPTFFAIDQTYPALNQLTQNAKIITSEFEEAYKQTKRLPNYHDIDPGEKAISATTNNNWSVFMLYLLGHKPEETRQLCPETCRLLEGIPNLVQAFFSILAPHKSIPPHEGPYLGYLRYHLGLRVPTKNPPKIIVNNQDYTWREGEAVLFDDSWTHAVENNSDEIRAVLIVDVLRPMPILPTIVNKFATNIIAKHTYGRSVIKRVKQYATASAPLIQ